MRPSISLVLAGALALVPASCGDPTYVEKVTIANPYEYDVHVEAGGGKFGLLDLGTVRRNQEETVQQVIDMGDRWVFRFRFRDDEDERIEMSRSELSSAGWRVEIPKGLTERLRAKREPPSFRRAS